MLMLMLFLKNVKLDEAGGTQTEEQDQSQLAVERVTEKKKKSYSSYMGRYSSAFFRGRDLNGPHSQRDQDKKENV